jgi:hypothetical protein
MQHRGYFRWVGQPELDDLRWSQSSPKGIPFGVREQRDARGEVANDITAFYAAHGIVDLKGSLRAQGQATLDCHGTS